MMQWETIFGRGKTKLFVSFVSNFTRIETVKEETDEVVNSYFSFPRNGDLRRIFDE